MASCAFNSWCETAFNGELLARPGKPYGSVVMPCRPDTSTQGGTGHAGVGLGSASTARCATLIRWERTESRVMAAGAGRNLNLVSKTEAAHLEETVRKSRGPGDGRTCIALS